MSCKAAGRHRGCDFMCETAGLCRSQLTEDAAAPSAVTKLAKLEERSGGHGCGAPWEVESIPASRSTEPLAETPPSLPRA